jgi:cyclophilin family peptidyl-prolyl cis-trans isomerase
METNVGNIEIELYKKQAPISVKNFLAYANSGFYNGTVFHRVIPDFMIQGGGFTENMKKKNTSSPIKNESNKTQRFILNLTLDLLNLATVLRLESLMSILYA